MMKIGPKFRHVLPSDNQAISIAVLDRFQWNLSTQKSDGSWKLFSGNVLLMETGNELELRSFLAGMALAFGMLPPEVADKFIDMLQP